MTNKYTIPNKILFSVSALAAFLLAAGTVAALIAQPAAAQDTLIPTTTHQAQTCNTAGSESSISISCNGTFNNNVANSPNRPNPPSAELRCPTDYTLSQGLCTAQPICPSGSTLNTLGQCATTTDIGPGICPAGVFNFAFVGGRVCAIAITPDTACPPGTHLLGATGILCQSDTTPIPVCSSGNLNPSTGRCEVTTTTPATCPGGITPTNGQCITRPS
ncbi:MAG TPA: hypothetical protein VH796_03110 [Nitrososphaeraceae archaeon]